MLKLLFLLVMALGCTTTSNNFSEEANVFLDNINGSTYLGIGIETGTTFRPNDTIISVTASASGSEFSTRRVLKFQNTRNNGSSETEGIYLQQKTPSIPTFPAPPAGETIRYVGIVRSNNFLLQTPFAGNPESLDWNSLTELASR